MEGKLSSTSRQKPIHCGALFSPHFFIWLILEQNNTLIPTILLHPKSMEIFGRSIQIVLLGFCDLIVPKYTARLPTNYYSLHNWYRCGMNGFDKGLQGFFFSFSLLLSV